MDFTVLWYKTGIPLYVYVLAVKISYQKIWVL